MNHEEHNSQVVAVKVLRLRYPILERLMWSIPNGEERPKVRRIIRGKEVWWCPSGKRAKDEGQLSGVWDIMVAVVIRGWEWGPDGKKRDTFCPGLIIEMKSKANFKKKDHGLTPDQILFQKAMVGQNWESEICDSAESMIDKVDGHMKRAGY